VPLRTFGRQSETGGSIPISGSQPNRQISRLRLSARFRCVKTKAPFVLAVLHEEVRGCMGCRQRNFVPGTSARRVLVPGEQILLQLTSAAFRVTLDGSACFPVPVQERKGVMLSSARPRTKGRNFSSPLGTLSLTWASSCVRQTVTQTLLPFCKLPVPNIAFASTPDPLVPAPTSSPTTPSPNAASLGTTSTGSGGTLSCQSTTGCTGGARRPFQISLPPAARTQSGAICAVPV
jgi:hypothetical protein